MSKPTPKEKPKIDPAFALRRAIVALSDTLPSHAKCVVDQFIRFVSPVMTQDRGVSFPHTCRRHPLDVERCSGTGKFPLLYFHVGNAVLAYYGMLAGDKLAEAEATFNMRVNLLEDIAVLGMDQYTIHGNERIGYTLMSLADAQARRTEEKRAESDRFKAEDESNAAIDRAEQGGSSTGNVAAGG